MNIKSKATLFATAAFAGILALAAVVVSYRIKADFGEVLGGQQFTLVRQEAKELDEKFALRLRVLKGAAAFIARDGFGRPQGMEHYLARLFALTELFDDLFLFSADGAMLDNYPFIGARQASSSADRQYFQDTVATKAGVISQPYVGKGNKQPNVMLTAPILNAEGKVIAVLGGQLNLMRPNFLGALGAAKVGRSGEFKVLSLDRTIVLSHHMDRVMTAGPNPGDSLYFDRAMAGGEGWEVGVFKGGDQAVISYKQLATVPWVLVAAMPVEEAYAPVAKAQKSAALIGLGLTLLLAPLIWLGVRHLLDPLVALRDAIRRLRQAPEAAVVLPERNRDEIGDLARDFNALMRERAEAQSALQESEGRFREVTDNVEALIGYIDADRRFRFNNRTYETWFGVERAQINGRLVHDVIGDEAYARFGPFIDRALAGERVEFQTEVVLDGRSRALQGIYVPHRGADGAIEGIYGFLTDITQLKEAEQRLRHAAHYDALTGAANRALFIDRLEQAAVRSHRSGSLLAVMYLDIDKFKQVNDSLGHAAGDELLKDFSARLHKAVRKSDTVARLGGDEFVVMLEDLKDRRDAFPIAEKILASMREGCGGTGPCITTSIGITFVHRSEQTADDLLRRADGALYEAKAAGRDTYRIAA